MVEVVILWRKGEETGLTFFDIYGVSLKAVDEERNEELKSMVQSAGRVNRTNNNSLVNEVKEAILDYIINKY